MGSSSSLPQIIGIIKLNFSIIETTLESFRWKLPSQVRSKAQSYHSIQLNFQLREQLLSYFFIVYSPER